MDAEGRGDVVEGRSDHAPSPYAPYAKTRWPSLNLRGRGCIRAKVGVFFLMNP
jgi:hypothetical protein